MTYAYYDDYRLKSASNSISDTCQSPYAYEAGLGSTLYPPVATPSTNQRFKSETFVYDDRGNLKTSTDDANDYPRDRLLREPHGIGAALGRIMGRLPAVRIAGRAAHDTDRICDPSAFWEDDASQEQIYLADGTAHVFVGNALPQPATGANGSVHMYLTFHDGRNSSAVLVDHDTGELVERTAYQPFGAPDIDYRPARWASFREDFKYGGHWDDAALGVVNYGARYYSPMLGRFISPDPRTIHALMGDPNPYEYALDNPIRYADRDGREPGVGTIVGGIIGGVGGGLGELGSELLLSGGPVSMASVSWGTVAKVAFYSAVVGAAAPP